MARRTKADALQTRNAIIKQALFLFATNGVHQTTLEQIALAVGGTRGTVYGHFASKNEILQAIGAQTATVLKERINNAVIEAKLSDPLAYLELYLQKILSEIQSDQEIYQAFAILNCKCEYIDDYKAVLDRMVFCYHEHIELFTDIYNRASTANSLKAWLNPRELATDTYAFLSGLIRLVLIEYYGDQAEINTIIKNHIKLRQRN